MKYIISVLLLWANMWSFDATVPATHVVKGRVLQTTGFTGIVAYSETTFLVDSIFKNTTNEILDTIKIFQHGADFGELVIENFDGDGFKNFEPGSEKIICLIKYFKQFKMVSHKLPLAVANIKGDQVSSFNPEGLKSDSRTIRKTNEVLNSRFPGSNSLNEYEQSLVNSINILPQTLANSANIAILVKVSELIPSEQGTEVTFDHIRTLKGNWNLLNKSILMPDSKTISDYGIPMPKSGDRILVMFNNERSLIKSSPWFFMVDSKHKLDDSTTMHGTKIESLFAVQGGQ